MNETTWYRTGTVTVTAGSKVVSGTGSAWLKQVLAGDLFHLADANGVITTLPAEVAQIASDTELVLKAAWSGATGSSQYAIVRNFTGSLPSDMAARLSTCLATQQLAIDQWLKFLTTKGPITLTALNGDSIQTTGLLTFGDTANAVTALQTALDGKAATLHGHVIGDVTGLQTALDAKQSTSGKDASGGYAGLTLFKINFKNALGTITSFFTNANTAARTYTFQDRDGTIADNADIAGRQPLDDALTALSGTSGSLGFRNKIINGDMQIDQRNYGANVVNPDAGTYIIDRWRIQKVTSAAIDVRQIADSPAGSPSPYCLQATVTTAQASLGSGDFVALIQLIEGYNVRPLLGRQASISFWVRASKAGAYCVALRNNGSTASDISYCVLEYTVTAANVWERKVLTIPIGLGVAGLWNFTNGAGLRVIFMLAAGASIQGATVGAWTLGLPMASSNQVNCSGTVGNTFAITGVQLENGPKATEFESRHYGLELLLCQRYYEVCSFLLSASIGPFVTYPYKATKRVIPTLILIPGSGSGGAVSTGTGADNAQSFYQITAHSINTYSTVIADAELR